MFEEKFIDYAQKPNHRLNRRRFEESPYAYPVMLMKGEFSLKVTLIDDETFGTIVTDTETGEEYTLHKASDAQGEFVVQLREQYRSALRDAAAACGISPPKTGPLPADIVPLIRREFGDEPDRVFADHPEYAVWRVPESGKWYAISLGTTLDKLGIPSKDPAELLNVKVPPDLIEELIDNVHIFRAWHMNKKHWISILIDGTFPQKRIIELVGNSLELVRAKYRPKSDDQDAV